MNSTRPASIASTQHPADPLTSEGLGHALRLLRARRHLTQRDLAGQAGLRRQHLSEIEQGQANPTLSTVSSVAGALGLKPSEFLAEAERHSHRPPRAVP